jgi:hypothetical protein
MESRVCSRCNQRKPLAEMHRTRTRVYGYCKKCLYRLQMIRWNTIKVRAITYLGGRCKRCGFQGHPVLFDFDHRDPSCKECGWNKLRLRSWESIRCELDKCDLLCAFCHRLQHLNPDVWPDLK